MSEGDLRLRLLMGSWTVVMLGVVMAGSMDREGAAKIFR